MDKYDFSGWATRHNIKCSDGRTILKDAFKHYDGKVVPLVWGHQHDEPSNVLGHALLEYRDEGMYTYGSFNQTENGLFAKECVEHGDITALSIYANHLKQIGDNVSHGELREVSLVLAGANPEAFIDVIMEHGDEPKPTDAAYIYTGEEIELCHSDDDTVDDTAEHADDDDSETIKDIFDTLTEKQKKVVYALIAQAIDEAGSDNKTAEHSDGETNTSVEGETVEHTDSEETVADIFNAFTDKQKQVVYAMVGEALASTAESGEGDTATHSDINNNNNLEGGTTTMKKNVFDTTTTEGEAKVLSHDDMKAILGDIKSAGSLKEAVLRHGISDIDYLVPEATVINTPPSLITRDQTWVTKIMSGVHRTPFSRIKSLFADITEADARAKGYIKGSLKTEEVFTLLKRTTLPSTVYKKQKLDRDDIIDITDFDVVSWLKGEMRLMLDEELARAFLVGDGRISSSDDKINETNIRPIWTDADLFTVKRNVIITDGSTVDQAAKAFMRACVKSRKAYKGSGNPTLYTTEDILTDCLLMEDTTGRVIYDSAEKLASALRVREIVTVPVMDSLVRTDPVLGPLNLLGIIVNPADYNIGADKGGAVNMFDDFDIDYNAQKYLIETRCSGALTKPYSAIALETATAWPTDEVS